MDLKRIAINEIIRRCFKVVCKLRARYHTLSLVLNRLSNAANQSNVKNYRSTNVTRLRVELFWFCSGASIAKLPKLDETACGTQRWKSGCKSTAFDAEMLEAQTPGHGISRFSVILQPSCTLWLLSARVYNLLLLPAALLLFIWSTAANEFELYLWDTFN